MRPFRTVDFVASAGLEVAVVIVLIPRTTPETDFVANDRLVILPSVAVLVESAVRAGGASEFSCVGWSTGVQSGVRSASTLDRIGPVTCTTRLIWIVVSGFIPFVFAGNDILDVRSFG